MKAVKIERHRAKPVLLIALLVALVGILVALAIGFGKLRALYLEQCIIRKPASQVFITTGKLVKSDVITEAFGLKTGANLALIDFKAKRELLLKRVPTLRTVSISRRLPDRVYITAEERTPVARLGLCGSRQTTGKVTDIEGVVFNCRRGTDLLPVVREARAPGTAVGQRLSRRTCAALETLDLGRDPEFSSLGILEVDVSSPDFLLLTLGNYSQVKLAWEGMDEPSPESHERLRMQLQHLVKAINSKLAGETLIWNATMPKVIFADEKGNRR